MSSYHQTASQPAKPDRRVEHHRERQATRVALLVSDLEEVLSPRNVHNIAAPLGDWPVDLRTRRSRQSKPLIWKRRTRRARGEE
jgi:hypothetical protein